MGKIRDEAEHDLKWARVWPEDDHLEKQAQRVLLLKSACDKYEQALSARDSIEADALQVEAQELIKQAEEL